MGNFRVVYVQFNKVDHKLFFTYIKAMHREIRSSIFSRELQISGHLLHKEGYYRCPTTFATHKPVSYLVLAFKQAAFQKGQKEILC